MRSSIVFMTFRFEDVDVSWKKRPTKSNHVMKRRS